ncbi:MAG: hypothetical protein IT462_16710 [Planctomycetes bacterium]|nr:hypothetical protein [Planctomycetota bacterium]
MPYVKRSFLTLLAVVAATVLIGNSLRARDMSPYGEYLGTQLRMFDEAERILRKQIESGSEKEKGRARVSLAKVIKQKADENFQKNGNESERDKLYDEAQKVFGGVEPKEGAEKVDLAVIRLELAKALANSGSAKARPLAEAASKALSEELTRLKTVRDKYPMSGFAVMEDDVANWQQFVRCGFEYCKSFYIISLTHPVGGDARRDWIAKCTAQIDEFQFDVGIVCVELLESMMLKGELQLALSQPEGAVNEFLSVPSFLSNQSVNYVVGLHSLNGYLRAAEVLTRDLGDEPANLKRVKDLYQEAWNKFGKEQGLVTEFKRFKLYRISAMIRLGEDMEATVKELFSLAADPDPAFKRQALAVLAEISVRPGLEIEVRFKCAREVGRNSENVGQLLRAAQAFQSLISQCGTVEQFEKYAPAAYLRVGDIYEKMFRFLDASIVYREAAYRTGYFRTKFGGADETEPAAGQPLGDDNKHMEGRCDAITDSKTAYGYPLMMAKNFLKVTKWLTSSQYGDQTSNEFKKLFEEANNVVANYGDQDQMFENLMRQASEQVNRSNWAQAAVRYLKIPSVFKKYHLCLDNAARCYRELAGAKNSLRMNTRGSDEEVESPQFFKDQQARHEPDLNKLPKNLWEGIDARHWDVINNAQTEGDVANWHKAVYYYQKYFMFLLIREWERVSKRIEPEKADWIDALIALCESKQEDWIKIPAATRKPDAELRRLALSMHNFAYLLRVMPASVKDVGENKARTKMEDEYRPMAIKLLRRMPSLFELHFRLEGNLTVDELKLNRDFTQSVVDLSFYAMVDDLDADGAEAMLTIYREKFSPPADAADNVKKAAKKKLFDMIGRVYSLYLKVYDPRTQALNSAATNLRSRFNQLKLGLFVERIGPKYPEAAKRLDEAKGQLARDKALAQHFWDDWLVKGTFEASDNVKTLLAAELSATVKKKWDELAESYPARWAKAMRQDFDKIVKDKQFDGIRDEAIKLLQGGKDSDIVDKLEERGKQNDPSASLFGTLGTQVYLNTGHLRYFTGTVFVYEFGGFLNTVATDLDGRLRPLMVKVLTYYQMYQEAKREDTGVSSVMDAKDRFALGKQYFRVHDWERAINYLAPLLDEQVKAKAYGDRTMVPANVQTKKIGIVKSGEEVELCFQLGTAYFERYKVGGNVEDLVKAAPLMRRAYSFVQVRNANEMAKNVRAPFELTFKDEMENYYLDIVETMSEIYLELHKKGGVKADFLAAADQFNANLEVKKNAKGEPLMQPMPSDEASYLWEARRIRLDTWGAFYRLDDHPWRSEFRDNVMTWIQLTALWLKKYGKKPMGIAELEGGEAALKTQIEEAISVGTQNSEGSEHFEDEGTVAWKKDLAAAVVELKTAWANAK